MKSQRRPPRLLLTESIGSRRQLTLPADQANYLNRVLRLRVDSAVIVFDGQGAEHMARLAKYGKGSASIELLEPLPVMPQPELRILLLQGISKADRMDFAIQKSSELGVAEILPVYTQFSIVKLEPTRAARRVTHWQRVAGSACEQSGRHYPPRVHAPQALSQCVDSLPPDAPRLAFDPRGEQHLADVQSCPRTVAALVGPEGGLSSAELKLLRGAGFCVVRLGAQILRTETAALAACVLLQARWGELRDPEPAGR